LGAAGAGQLPQESDLAVVVVATAAGASEFCCGQESVSSKYQMMLEGLSR
jgi:hypothetical protein